MPNSDDEHYLKAVTELGDSRTVVATQPVYAASGMLLVKKGVRIDSRLYGQLIQHKLGTPIDHGLSIDEAVTTAELNQGVERLICERAMCARLVAGSGHRAAVHAAINSVALPPPIAFKLTLARERRPQLLRHSLLVTLVAVHLGIWMELASAQLEQLAAAALLHDLGVLHIDPALLDPGRVLSLDDRRHLYAHSLTSMLIVQQTLAYPQSVALAVFEHHERLDGTGYPRALYGEGISPMGRIILLSEVAATVIEDESWSPHLRLSVIAQLNRNKFDRAMLAHLLEHAPEAAGTQGGPSRVERLAKEFSYWGPVRAEFRALAAKAPAIGAFLIRRVEALERVLADAGVHPDQLALVTVGIEEEPQEIEELVLLARETGWQLREIIREVWRRWPDLAASAVPGERALMHWLRELDQRLQPGASRAAPGEEPT